MVVMQSEKVDGEKYLISMQSDDREGVTSPEGTIRVKVDKSCEWLKVILICPCFIDIISDNSHVTQAPLSYALAANSGKCVNFENF